MATGSSSSVRTAKYSAASKRPSSGGWQAGDEVIAHGNQWFRVVSLIPVERMAEFVDEPVGGLLEVEPL